jgi:hypothetical protein
MPRIYGVPLSLRLYVDHTGCFPDFLPHPLTRDLFWLLVGHGSRYMWDSVPIYPWPSPSLPYSSSLSLSLDVYFLSSLTWAFNSDWTGKWPLSEAQMASHSLSKDFPP